MQTMQRCKDPGYQIGIGRQGETRARTTGDRNPRRRRRKQTVKRERHVQGRERDTRNAKRFDPLTPGEWACATGCEDGREGWEGEGMKEGRRQKRGEDGERVWTVRI